MGHFEVFWAILAKNGQIYIFMFLSMLGCFGVFLGLLKYSWVLLSVLGYFGVFWEYFEVFGGIVWYYWVLLRKI